MQIRTLSVSRHHKPLDQMLHMTAMLACLTPREPRSYLCVHGKADNLHIEFGLLGQRLVTHAGRCIRYVYSGHFYGRRRVLGRSRRGQRRKHWLLRRGMTRGLELVLK